MEKKDDDGKRPFERLQDLARRIVSVPKAEVERKGKKPKARRRRTV